MANGKRLIDANALKKKAEMRGHCIRPLVTAYHLCVAVSDIDNATTVDAVEVVRCKDCANRVEFDDKAVCGTVLPSRMLKEYLIDGNTILAIVSDDDFCAHGVRRDADGG